MNFRACAGALVALLACGPRGAVVPSDVENAAEGPWQALPCVDRRKLDILLVVEDSPALVEEQPQVAEAARWVVEWLDEYGDTDFRLAVTSTHVNGPHCPARAGDGALTTTTCRARSAEWADGGAGDVALATCLEECPLAELGRVPLDGAGPVMPWLESRSGRTNLRDGVDPGDAAACLALQGVGGCTFPAPLAAMQQALARSLDPGEPAFGFMRPDATLVVAFIGGTSDCSVERPAIFDPAGDRRFWSDPGRATPGVCWNAGVRCTGEPPEFTACAPESWDESGAPGASDGEAVLVPVERTIAFLRGLVAGGRTSEVIVTALAGVPIGYEDGSAELAFSRSCDAGTLTADGICPGCASEHGSGTPPVRVAAVVEAFVAGEERRVASICSGSPASMWAPTADTLVDQVAPNCVETCVADTDPATAATEPRCEVVEALPGEAPRPVPPCERELVDGEPRYRVPEGEERCHALLVDDGGVTPGPLDDISPECVAGGFNAEVKIVRAATPLDGTCVSIRCVPSDRPEADCPFLGESSPD